MINFLVEIDARFSVSNTDVNGINIYLSFLSNPLNPENPSNNIILNKNVPVRLIPPSFNRKLSDVINGVYLNQGFSLTLINNDGYFDNDKKNYSNFPETNYFGADVRLYKTNKINPEYSDFNLIGKGVIINTITTFNDFIIEVADDLKSLNNDFSKPISELNISFPYYTYHSFFGAGGMIDNTLKDNIPYVYGTSLIELKHLTTNAILNYLLSNAILQPQWIDASFEIYFLANNIQEILAIYNSKGEQLDFLQYWENYTANNSRLKILDNRQNMCVIYRKYDNWPINPSPPELIEQDKQPAFALVKGGPSNIGEVIKDILYTRQNISYNNYFFNVKEYDLFIAQTHNISTVISSGSIKQVINNVIKNDNAFFIQQPDGRLTIRRYDLDYNEKTINNKYLTKIENKSFNDFDNNFIYNILIRYNLEINPQLPLPETRIGFISLVNNNSKSIYKKSNIRAIDTQIINNYSANNFGQNILNRFSYAKIILKISVGYDISDYNLLDTVTLNLTDINNRNFSEAKRWKIIEINYAHDTLVLEEII